MQVVVLLASELVSNAVRHAGAESVALSCTVQEGSVRVEVCDDGPGFAGAALPLDSSRIGGWGLYIVDQLASRWGRSDESANRVWFEVDRRPAARTSAYG